MKNITRHHKKYIEKKKTADQRWDELLSRLKKGEVIPHDQIYHAMEMCDYADLACLREGCFE